MINGAYRGACVIGVDSNKWRAEYALKLGATAVVDPSASDALQQILDLTDGRGADHAIDCWVWWRRIGSALMALCPAKAA